MNAPKLAGAPSVSDSVAGTEPPTSPGTPADDQTYVCTPAVLALDVVGDPLQRHRAVQVHGLDALTRPSGAYAFEAFVGVEPSSV